jgi:hypothetical protein
MASKTAERSCDSALERKNLTQSKLRQGFVSQGRKGAKKKTGQGD